MSKYRRSVFRAGVVVLLLLAALVATAASLSTPAVSADHVACGDTLITDTVLDGDLTCPGDALTITGNGITLDCAGNKISVTPLAFPRRGIGVHLNGANGSTVKNCVFLGFSFAVRVDSGSGNTIADNDFTNVFTGIGASIWRSEGNTISGNLIEGLGVDMVLSSNNAIDGNRFKTFGGQIRLCCSANFNSISGNILSGGETVRIDFDSEGNKIVDNSIDDGVILLKGADRTTVIRNRLNLSEISVFSSPDVVIAGNQISARFRGVQLVGQNRAVVANNTISDADAVGLRIFSSGQIRVFNNNFINNVSQAEFGGTNTFFNLPAPTGGNYWDTFDESGEGCTDGDADGFCDSPFVFPGAQDNLPVTGQHPLDTTVIAFASDGDGIAIFHSSATGSDSATFSFISTAASVSGFECSLDGSSYSACTSPKTHTGLGGGDHTFRVRAIDALGNPDTTPDTISWLIDKTPPETTINQALAGLGNFISNGGTTDADFITFIFSGTDDAGFKGFADFECSLDGAPFTLCAGRGGPRFRFFGLAYGPPEFQVKAIDEFSNIDPTPATFVTSSSASYFGLAEAPHEFQVRAIDRFGNIDPTPATFNWTIGTNRPPVASAALVPIDVEEDEGSFQVAASATDPDGNLDSVVAVIKTPPLEGLDIELKVDDEIQIEFDFEEGKVEIKGPDPQAVLDQLLEFGGVIVPNGQLVDIELDGEDEEAEFKFKDDGTLKVEAPAFTLRVIATDTLGETNVATAEPVFAPSEDDGEEENEGEEGDEEDEEGDDD